MKLIKVLTSWTLIFALATLQIQGTKLVLNSSFAAQSSEEVGGENVEGETNTTAAAPTATAAPTLDYTASKNKSPKLTINQLMILFILLTGPTVGIGCFSQVSGKIFAASAAIYLIMEIMNYSTYKKASTSNEKMYATLDKDTADDQINAFNHAEQLELTAADALKKKKTNTTILAAGITAAAVASFVEFALATTSYTGCVAASFGTGLLFCDQAAIVVEACAISPLYIPVPAGPVFRATQASGHLMLANNSLNNSETKNLASIENFIKQNQENSSTETLNNDFSQALKTVFSEISKFLINTAKADEPAKSGLFSGLGISAAVLAIFVPFAALKSTKLLFIIASGLIRGIYFTILAGFAWLAVKEIGDGEKKLRGNAKIYGTLRDRLMQALNSKSRFAGINGPQNAFKNRLGAYAAIRDEMNNPPDGAICLTGNQGERRVDENCQCRKTNTCAKVDFSGVDFNGQGVPSFFGNSLGNLQSGANSLFGGNFAAADSQFGQFSNSAANIRKLNDQIKGKMQKILDADKNGKKINLAAVEEKAQAEAIKTSKSILDKFSASNPNALAALTGGTTGLNAIAEGEKIQDIKPEDLIASIHQNIEKQKEADPLAEFKFDFGEEEKTPETQQVVLSQGDALNEFVTNESDISDRPDENIFKIITVRYFKSAYPRIFNEDKKQSLE